jgi:hypothetical protein
LLATIADRLDRLGLERAQEPGLRRQRQLAELVEEQGTAGRLDERALALAIRAGERAADVAEQLRVDQVLGDRGAVDRHERPVRARRRVVHRPRRELLAGARLALDQDGRLGRSRELEHREQLAHRDAGADHRPEPGPLRRRHRRRVGAEHADRRRAELDGGTGRDHDLADP